MREILFRGKRLDNGEWVYGDLSLQNLCGVPLIYAGMNSDYKIDPETVGQYIGEIDDTGAKVFEGDIMLVDTEDGHKLFKIQFSQGEDEHQFICGFMGVYLGDADVYDEDDVPYYRVIGNIHDNPELLGKQL